MLNRAFEWYRTVNVQPAQGVLDNRIASVKDLIKAITSAKSWEVPLAWAAGVAGGFDINFRQDSPAVVQLIAAIKAHDTAFPEDLTENAFLVIDRVVKKLERGEQNIQSVFVKTTMGPAEKVM